MATDISKRKKQIQSIFRSMTTLRSMMGVKASQFLSRYRLTFPQVHLLYYLAEKKTASIKKIAEEMNITSSAATQIVEGLVRHNYLQRTVDPKDRRSVAVQFSETGSEQFGKFREEHISHVMGLLQDFSDAELEFFEKIPQKILARAKQIFK